ncbi:MAG: hypothetical protein AAFR04_08685 [Pseudomonadota bacterium]
MAKKTGKGKGKAAAKPNTKLGYKEFTVNVWVTDLNAFEFGFYKHSRNRAKSRQFSKDMDIIAEVSENGEQTGVLSYREDAWKNNEGMDKRLVLKLFTASLNWRATMDLMVGRSLQLTHGARGLPVSVFSVNMADYDNMVYLERSANKWWLMPEDFSFFIFGEGNRPHFYRLRRDLIAVGSDYTLYDEHDRPVGDLDGKIITLGGKWYGRVREDHADKRVMNMMKLFAGMLIFNNACRRHIKQLAYDVKVGRVTPKVESQEADLYMNPRRVR